MKFGIFPESTGYFKYEFQITGPDKCSQGEFNCGTGIPKCIPRLWVCDGESECNNGTDESTAACSEHLSFPQKPIFICFDKVTSFMPLFFHLPDMLTCRDDEFRCLFGYPACIHASMICDGVTQCSTEEDEVNCGEYNYFNSTSLS